MINNFSPPHVMKKTIQIYKIKENLKQKFQPNLSILKYSKEKLQKIVHMRR